jgi:hypothetical protein
MNEAKSEFSPGPWEVDTVRSDGEYGDGGPDSHVGFDAYAIFDSEGRVLFDSLNRDGSASEITEEGDSYEGYFRAWDAKARADAERIVQCVNAHNHMLEALEVVSVAPQVRGVYVLDEQDMRCVLAAIAKAKESA